MVKSTAKNGRTRRSGGRGRTIRGSGAEASTRKDQVVSVDEREDVVAEGAEICAVEEPSLDGTFAPSAKTACSETPVARPEEDACPSVDAQDEVPSENEASSVSAERGPCELDVLRGEIFSEELEQNAVEQMFQWMKERGGQAENEETELSGSALLEAAHHGRHVAELSLALFGALSARLGLNMRWARLLAQAALWHDLGFAVGGRRRHHKRSMEIIEGNDRLSLSFGLEESDRPMVALLARYHRRAWPSEKHRRFAALSEEDRKALCGAAALLRVADALDFRHKGAVEEVRVSLHRRSARVVCFGAESCRKECRRALKKGALLESLLGGRLEVRQGKEGDRNVF